MNDEKKILDAIKDQRQFDEPRLIAADWFDERNDPRGNYLRSECELVQTWWYDQPQWKLAEKVHALSQQVDPAWLHQIRRFSTPAPPIDLIEMLPSLHVKQRQTYRLYFRPGEGWQHESKLAGLFCWPADEPWPTCDEHQCFLYPTLQLRQEDVPGFSFPKSADLMQLLWCPFDHDPDFWPAPKIYWRKEKEVENPVEEHPGCFGPESADGDDSFLAEPCLLYTELITEYPSSDEELQNSIEGHAQILQAMEILNHRPQERVRLPEDFWTFVDSYLYGPPSSKMGGYPNWVQEAYVPTCECGRQMEFLLSLSEDDYDGYSWGRWWPIQDRHVLKLMDGGGSEVEDAPHWYFGLNGLYMIFMCRHCPDIPIVGFTH